MIFSGRTTKDGFGFLIFDQVDINIGGGLDGSIGVFKAPIAGIYKMTFSGPFGYTFIVKNASTYFYMYESYTAPAEDRSYTWMMELEAEDYVKLYSQTYFFADDNFSLTFTGELIHID